MKSPNEAQKSAQPSPQKPDDANTALLTCPISTMLFAEPVAASDGYFYEREMILEHVRKNGLISPMTRAPLASDPQNPEHPNLNNLFPIKSQVSDYTSKHPDVYWPDSSTSLYLPSTRWDALRQALLDNKEKDLINLFESDPRLACVSLSNAISQGLTMRTPLINDHKSFWDTYLESHSQTILNCLVKSGLFKKFSEDSKKLHLLLRNEGDDSVDQAKLFLLLSTCIKEKDLLLFEKLFVHLENVNLSLSYNQTLLHVCVLQASGQTDTVIAKKLLDRGADLSLVDESFEGQGCTVFHLCKNTEMAALLCLHGHHQPKLFEQTNWAGQTCFESANDAVLPIYLFANAPNTQAALKTHLPLVIERAKIERLKLILNFFPGLRGCDIHFLGLTALDLALIAQQDNTELLKLMLTMGWVKTEQETGREHITALAQQLNIDLKASLPNNRQTKTLFIKSINGKTGQLNFPVYESFEMLQFRIFHQIYPNNTCDRTNHTDVRVIYAGKNLYAGNVDDIPENSTLQITMRLKGD